METLFCIFTTGFFAGIVISALCFFLTIWLNKNKENEQPESN
jgi:hypothetical protein